MKPCATSEQLSYAPSAMHGSQPGCDLGISPVPNICIPRQQSLLGVTEPSGEGWRSLGGMFTHFYTFSHDQESPSIPFTKCWHQAKPPSPGV